MNFMRAHKFKVLSFLVLAAPALLTRCASAVSVGDEVELEFTLEPSISLSITGDFVIDDLVAGQSGSSSTPATISVTTNSAGGYVLGATVGNSSHSSSSLVNAQLSSLSFTMLGVDDSLAIGDFSSNTWGFSYDGGDTYTGLPLYSDSSKTIKTKTTPTNADTLAVQIAAKAASTQSAGIYENIINFIAVTQEPHIPCNGYTTMQNIASIAATMTTNTQVQLCDIRDEKLYWVAKLADGNVWMTQNLDLVLSTSTTLTPSDSNVSANWTPNSNTQTTQYKESGGTTHSEAIWDSNYNTTAHSYRPASDTTAGTSGDYGNDGDTYFSPVIMTNGTTMSSYKTEAECVAGGYTAEQCAHWNVGTFYSWYAATAGTGNASVSTAINVTDSICPKGWHLPSSTSSGEFQALVTAASLTGSNITGSPYYFLRAGYYYGNYGAVYDTGDYGYYWSRTSTSNSSGAYYLVFHSPNVSPSNFSDRYGGLSVRCIADS